MHLTKRALGVSYLVGTGSALSVVLLGRLALGQTAMVDVVGTTTGLFLSVALAYSGYWLAESELGGEQVWTVAKWGGLGFTVVTFATVGTVVIGVIDPGMHLRSNLLVSNVAAGGVVGVLVGGIRELKAEHEQTVALNQRNGVLNRVLRHNIRNDMNTILGYADKLEADLEAGRMSNGELGVIKGRARSVAALSDKARRIEEAFARERGERRSVDVGDLTARGVALVEQRYPDVDVSVVTEEGAIATAGEGVVVAVENLVENAIVHTEHGDPTVEVGVVAEGDWVVITVADDGPGIPPGEIDVLSAAEETALQHGNGLGLWLVKWLVESYGGKLTFEDRDVDGSIVRLRLPRATQASKQRQR